MNNLLRLIGRRLIALPIMIFGVTILVFFIMALSPIDQAYQVLGENATEAQAEAYRAEHGLNDPVIVQYGNYMVGLCQGDLGSYGANNASVGERIASALPITLQLTFMGLIIAVILATILGVISALYRDRWPDQVIRVFSIACIATIVLARGAHDSLVFVHARLASRIGQASRLRGRSGGVDTAHGNARNRPCRSRNRPAHARHPNVNG